MFFKRRGQVGLEFMLVTGVALFTMIIFAIILSQILSDKQDERVLILAEDLTLSLKQEISFASNAEEGYTRELYLPRTIDGRDYEVILGSTKIGTGYFELIVDDIVFFEVIPLTLGEISPGRLKISKLEDHVFVEAAQ